MRSRSWRAPILLGLLTGCHPADLPRSEAAEPFVAFEHPDKLVVECACRDGHIRTVLGLGYVVGASEADAAYRALRTRWEHASEVAACVFAGYRLRELAGDEGWRRATGQLSTELSAEIFAKCGADARVTGVLVHQLLLQ